MILGVDEAGRGPWAGPLVVGAVVLGGADIDGLTDSKKLTKLKRELLYREVTAKAVAYSSGWVSAVDIDRIGLSQALRLATRLAVAGIDTAYSEIIIDGTVNFLADTGKGKYVQTMPKADLLVPSVSAASIIAKFERDEYMKRLDNEYPGYGFGSHAGYGVARHRTAIDELGVTPEHRLSFAPLAKFTKSTVGDSPAKTNPVAVATTKAIGDQAESVAVEYLQAQGHNIIDRNWRTKFCEIDIISYKQGTIYFVEVKHRKDDKSGGGLSYITTKKLKQMNLAARLYVHSSSIKDVDLRLVAIATSGEPPAVSSYVEVN